MEKNISVRWMGHATWELKTSSGKKIVIDPWYTDNPRRPENSDDLTADYVLITHDHWDHVKDVPTFVRNGAKVITQPEVEKRLVEEHSLSSDSFERINTGGTITLEDGIQVTLIQAFHSADSGTPGGLIIRFGDVTIMNTGDTALHKDLELYGRLYQPTLLMLPIGDRFTMGIRDAAEAVAMIQPKHYVPQHYNTFAAINQDAARFEAAVKETGSEAGSWIPEPGEAKTWTAKDNHIKVTTK